MKLKELEELFKPPRPKECQLKDLQVGEKFRFKYSPQHLYVVKKIDLVNKQSYIKDVCGNSCPNNDVVLCDGVWWWCEWCVV